MLKVAVKEVDGSVLRQTYDKERINICIDNKGNSEYISTGI